MSKITIGISLIILGLLYSLLAWHKFYDLTLGKMVEKGFIKPPKWPESEDKPTAGRDATILMYGFGIVVLGILIIVYS